MKLKMLREHRSIIYNDSFEIANFCVLTGKNGSGKTHYLEAIQNPSLCQVVDAGRQLSRFQYVGFGGLSPSIQSACGLDLVLSQSRQLYAAIKKRQEIVVQRRAGGAAEIDPLEGLSPDVASSVRNLIKLSSKKFMDLTENDAFLYLEGKTTREDNIFFSHIAMKFKSYHTKKVRNEFKEFQNRVKKQTSIAFLSDDQFQEKFGPPPWDLVNHVLLKSGLPYTINSPEGMEEQSEFVVKLFDKDRHVEIGINDLSTGEKVLMSLALAIYNFDEDDVKPDCLLLDEPDAPLHPEFSKRMIDVLYETVFKRAGVNVVMTTHSPTTVAVAPYGSVFLADGGSKPLAPVSAADALEVLADGIPNLRVNVERRRQVFVEGQNDVQYYSRVYEAIRCFPAFEFDFDPVFLEPHGRTPNCEDAVRLAKSMFDAGGDNVRALIDYDLVNEEKHPVYIFGEGSRYSIENFILDPIYVFLALVKFRKLRFIDAGISSVDFYPNAQFLQDADLQKVIDWTLGRVNLLGAEKVTSTLVGGHSVRYPRVFLEKRGHDYEGALRQAFPELGAIVRGNGDAALKLGVLDVIEEIPIFLDSVIQSTFNKLR